MDMRRTVLLLGLGTSVALADADAVATCRAAHAGDPAAHIECLEHALRGQAPIARGPSDQNQKLGAEQVRTARREPADSPVEMRVQIESVSYSEQGRGLFQMADGQLWSETERSARNERLSPGQSYSARIERGVLGGYRMYVDGMRRMIKVERLK